MPTITLRYPSNIPGTPGHNWANAHCDGHADRPQRAPWPAAKVQAMTMLDFLLQPELVQGRGSISENVQTKDEQYKSFLRPDDRPAVWLNQKIMEQFRPRLKPFYYDSSRYKTYLEQLGIKYPSVR